MIKVNMIGKLVYTVPCDWSVCREGGADRKKLDAVRSNLAVAFHANLGRRQGRECASLDCDVTESTVYAQVSCVDLVAELDRLSWAVSHVEIVARPVISESRARK